MPSKIKILHSEVRSGMFGFKDEFVALVSSFYALTSSIYLPSTKPHSNFRKSFKAYPTNFNLFPFISKFYTRPYILVSIFYFLSLGANGQSLHDYQKLAAENNPGLLSMYKEFESALQRVPQVKSLPDPTFTISAFGQMTQTRTGQQMAIFNLSQMFPWFGTLKAQGDVAALQSEATYQEYLDNRNHVNYQVAESYYSLFELKEWIQIEEKNIRILESYKSLATIKFQNGKSSMVDVLRADLMLKEAITNVSILNQKKRPLEARFNSLLNREMSDSIVMPDTLEIEQISKDYRRDSLLLSNPLLSELDLKLQASEASERIAIKQGIPQFGVGFQYIIVAPRTDASVPQNGRDAYMPMLTMSLPIFRGRYRANQKETQFIQESLALKKEDVSNRLTSSYERAWFEIQMQAELIQLYGQQIQESEHSLNLLFSAFSNSGKDFEEVLRMQQQILNYQKTMASALAKYHSARAELDYISAK